LAKPSAATIAFGLPEYNKQRVCEAAEIASLHGDVQVS